MTKVVDLSYGVDSEIPGIVRRLNQISSEYGKQDFFNWLGSLLVDADVITNFEESLTRRANKARYFQILASVALVVILLGAILIQTQGALVLSVIAGVFIFIYGKECKETLGAQKEFFELANKLKQLRGKDVRLQLTGSSELTNGNQVSIHISSVQCLKAVGRLISRKNIELGFDYILLLYGQSFCKLPVETFLDFYKDTSCWQELLNEVGFALATNSEPIQTGNRRDMSSRAPDTGESVSSGTETVGEPDLVKPADIRTIGRV